MARSRPIARRRRLLAERLDDSTRRLLKRTALAIGISGVGAAVLGAPAFALTGCTGTTSIVCNGLFTSGILFDGFTETGAGPLNLVVLPGDHNAISVAGGAEFGGEIAITDNFILRPFVSYQYLGVLEGRVQEITAGFEGAPAGVTPFTVSNATDRTLHKVGAGFDVVRSDDFTLRVNYSGLYGATSHQEFYAMKLAFLF